MRTDRALAALAAGLLAVLPVLCGCRSTAPGPPRPSSDIEQAISSLSRPLPGSMAALYRLRVPSTGGLRLSVLARGDAGRLSIAEPFGSLLSVTAWSPNETTRTADLRAGCIIEAAGMAEVFGMLSLPLAQAVRLLGGRLPILPDEQVVVVDTSRLRVNGVGWSAVLRLEEDPWRVVEVTDTEDAAAARWSIELDDHSSSVPGFVRFDHEDGQWAELELVGLEWQSEVQLQPLPELPPCNEVGGPL